MHNLPPIEFLNECFQYVETGGLIWRVRPREHFNSEKGWKIFNTSYSGTRAGSKIVGGYSGVIIRGTVNAGRYLVHRVVWKMHHGTNPVGFIDHANGNKQDNRIENLREATVTENLWNSRKRRGNMSSSYKGVCKVSGCNHWRAYIQDDGKQRFLGNYRTEIEAHEAYRQAAIRLHGAFAHADLREAANAG